MNILFSVKDEHINFICDGLNKTNENHNVTPYQNKKTFGFFALENDKIIGGIYGSTDMGNWAHIELLYVEDNYRGKNIGTKLFESVENFAKQNNYTGIHLTTWNWQAKGFYEKMGCTVFGELENHPPNGKRYYLKKIIIPD